jgi:cell division protein FtsB
MFIGLFSSLFADKYSKYIGIFVLIVFVVCAAFGYVKLKEHQAAQAALESFNQAQIQQAQKDNELYRQEVTALEKYATELSTQIADKNKEVTAKSDKTIKYIKSQKPSKVDPMFNNVLKRIR